SDRTAGRVDVEVDVLFRILGREQQKLRADGVGVLVPHLGPEPDDALFEQAVVDVVFAAGGLDRCHLRSGGFIRHAEIPLASSPGLSVSRRPSGRLSTWTVTCSAARFLPDDALFADGASAQCWRGKTLCLQQNYDAGACLPQARPPSTRRAFSSGPKVTRPCRATPSC